MNAKDAVGHFYAGHDSLLEFTTTDIAVGGDSPSFKSILRCPAVNAEDVNLPMTEFEGMGDSKSLAEEDASIQAIAWLAQQDPPQVI